MGGDPGQGPPWATCERPPRQPFGSRRVQGLRVESRRGAQGPDVHPVRAGTGREVVGSGMQKIISKARTR